MGRDLFYHETGGIYMVNGMIVGESLSHHGTKGMKWGVRKYQNPDGSLTAAGRARYGKRASPTLVKAGRAIRQKVAEYRKQRAIKKTEKNLRKGKDVRSLRSLSNDEIKKITDRLKSENELLSELETKQRHIHNVRELKKNRTTLYSKYGNQIVNKVVDKALDTAKEKAVNADRFEAERQKAVAETAQRGKNDLAAIKLRNELGVNNQGNKQTGQKNDKPTSDKPSNNDKPDKGELPKSGDRKLNVKGTDKVREEARKKADQAYHENVDNIPTVRNRRYKRQDIMNELSTKNVPKDYTDNVENPFALMNFLGYI